MFRPKSELDVGYVSKENIEKTPEANRHSIIFRMEYSRSSQVILQL